MNETVKTQPSTDNQFKAANQLRKALKLAPVLIACGGTVESCADSTVRRLVEKIAGIGESSNTTWAMVAVLLEGDA